MSQVTCIVGMHRSGTSCLAGTLQESGLHLGEVITEAPHNAKGNRENRRIMDLQEAVLVHSGGSWERIPERLAWTDEHRRARDEIIRSYGDGPFGFKDPRTLVTLPFWQEVIPEMRFVGTFRHPSLVVRSLLARNGGDPAHWLGLWAAYNERLLALHAAEPFPVLRFDVTAEAYRLGVTAVARSLGLAPPSALAFFEESLRHHALEDDVALPADVRAIHERLVAIAI
ncbi:MAG TPA: hypothetical protein VHE30_11480 [Polyangiaceae bacterium]|nr:hypothetical protein [Polyangiaceae bacterium]